jgi:hypothetical protein
MHILNWLERGVRSLSCRVQLCAALILLVGFGLGCCTGTPTMGPIPQCPEPTDALIHEILEGLPPATEEYIARTENLCSALRSMAAD